MHSKEERKEYHRKWRENNRERWNAYGNKWYWENRRHALKQQAEYGRLHKEQIAEKSRRWAENNKEYRADEQRRRLSKYKRLVVDAYGGHCACCKETEIRFLTVEHLQKNGMEHRKVGGNFYLYLIKNNFPKEGLCILCMNCNWAERNGEPCPHKPSSAPTSAEVANDPSRLRKGGHS